MDSNITHEFASCCDDGVPDNDQLSDKDNSEPSSDFSERTWRDDLTLLVEGEKLYVSKTVLAIASPVFDRMFQTDFKEKSQTELELPGKNVSNMREFLRSIYPVMKDISDVNVYKLLPLAEEYQVTPLKASCEKFLLSRLNNELPADDLKVMLQNAAKYKLEGLLYKFCEEEPEHTAKHIIADKVGLPSKVFIRILEQTMKRLELVREQNSMLNIRVYKYFTSGLSRTERQVIEKYDGWKSKSLYIKLNADDIRSNSPSKTKRFGLFNESENCMISISSKDVPTKYTTERRMCVEISVLEPVANTLITVHGRLVIVNASSKSDNYKHSFQMEFKEGQDKCLVETNNINSVIDVANGYVYYNCLDAEVHLLAKRDETN